MTRHRALSLLLMLSATVGSTTPTLALTGEEFYGFCKSDDPVKSASGMFYAISIADNNLIINHGDPERGRFCIPFDTSRKKIFSVACKRFEENEDWFELNATWGIRQNFKRDFPCKQKV